MSCLPCRVSCFCCAQSYLYEFVFHKVWPATSSYPKTCKNVQLLGSGMILSKYCALAWMISEPPILEDLEGPRPSLISSTFNLFYCRVVLRKSIRFTRMPSNARRAAWHFDALWAVPAQLFGPTALIDRKCLLKGLDSLLQRDLVERPTFPTY